MTTDNHALFQVSLKVLLENEGKILVLRTQKDYVDFPGGRISQGEETVPFADIIRREITEELGANIRYELGRLAFASNRQYNFIGVEHHIAALFYNAKLLQGELKLSDEHNNFEWLTPKEIITLPKEAFISLDEYNQINACLSEY